MTIAWPDIAGVRVPAPAVVPHPFGLFSVAPPTSPADSSWVGGVQWESVACMGTPDAWQDPCLSGAAGAPKNLETTCAWIQTNSFVVYSHARRSTQSPDVADADARAMLAAGEEFAVEKALWDKMAASVTESAAADAVEALAQIEQDLATNYHGTGVIHVTRHTATHLGAQNLVRVGSHLETTIGTPVAVGGGYTSGIYGTGALLVLRDTVQTFNSSDLAHNDLFTIAERSYLVGWDCYITGRTITAP